MGVEVALVAMAVGAGVGAYGQYQAGKAAKADAENQADWHEYNAKVEDQNKKVAAGAARQNVRDNRKQAERILARNRAFMAEKGIAPTGTPLKVAGYTANQLDKDIQTSFVNDLLVAEKHRNQATLDRMAGSAAKQRGDNAYRAGKIKAGATILSGAGRTYGAGHDWGVWN